MRTVRERTRLTLKRRDRDPPARARRDAAGGAGRHDGAAIRAWWPRSMLCAAAAQPTDRSTRDLFAVRYDVAMPTAGDVFIGGTTISIVHQ